MMPARRARVWMIHDSRAADHPVVNLYPGSTCRIDNSLKLKAAGCRLGLVARLLRGWPNTPFGHHWSSWRQCTPFNAFLSDAPRIVLQQQGHIKEEEEWKRLAPEHQYPSHH